MTSAHPTPPTEGHNPVYPFAEWLNGNTWTLIRGRDFWGPPHYFVRKLEASARARRLSTNAVYDPDGRYVTVSARPLPDKPRAPADRV